MQERGSITDLVFISKNAWTAARWHAGGMKTLDEQKGALAPHIKRMANLFGVTPRTVRRWLTLYRRNPDPISLLPKRRGPQLGHRRLSIAVERVAGGGNRCMVCEEPLPVSCIIEESARRCKALALKAPIHRESIVRSRPRGPAEGRSNSCARARSPPSSVEPASRDRPNGSTLAMIVCDAIGSHISPISRSAAQCGITAEQ
jgi:hypothetical protein